MLMPMLKPHKTIAGMAAKGPAPLTVRKNNFDLLRLLLAFSVFYYHCHVLTGNSHLSLFSYLLNSERAIQGFFVISGFLIFMSYEKSGSMGEYYQKRVRRLYPAYFFTIILFPIAFSLISTDNSLNYFTSVKLYKYLLSNLLFLNFLQPSLPGVFQNHLISAVNGALWTLKIEVAFYIIVPFIVFLLRKYNKVLIFTTIYILSSLYLYYFRNIFVSDVIARQLPGQLSYFCLGGMAYYYFDYFNKYGRYLFFIALGGYIANYFINLIYFLPIFIAIIVIYFANCFYYLGNYGKYGDISYGVYIYHFPIIQLFIYFGLFESNPFLSLIITTILLIILSLFSWHFIERKYLLRSSHYLHATAR